MASNNSKSAGIKLKFELDDYMLAIKLLGRYPKFQETLIAELPEFKKYLPIISSIKNLDRAFISKKMIKNFNKFPKDWLPYSMKLKKLAGIITTTKIFQKLKKQTKKYMKTLESKWNTKKNLINKIVYEVIRTPINDIFTVFVSHPNTHVGHNISYFPFSKNTLVWGHDGTKFPNYALVYLIHEIFHSFWVNIGLENNPITHIVQEFVADNELRVALDKRKKEKFNKAHIVGHTFHKKIAKELYPYWKQYKNSNLDIIKFCRKLFKIFPKFMKYSEEILKK